MYRLLFLFSKEKVMEKLTELCTKLFVGTVGDRGVNLSLNQHVASYRCISLYTLSISRTINTLES